MAQSVNGMEILWPLSKNINLYKVNSVNCHNNLIIWNLYCARSIGRCSHVFNRPFAQWHSMALSDHKYQTTSIFHLLVLGYWQSIMVVVVTQRHQASSCKWPIVTNCKLQTKILCILNIEISKSPLVKLWPCDCLQVKFQLKVFYILMSIMCLFCNQQVYYKEAVGAFVVFDVTRASTFEAVEKWKSDLDSKVFLSNGSPIPAILLANKVRTWLTLDRPKPTPLLFYSV